MVAAKQQGVRQLVGTTMSVNRPMLAVARELGFKLVADPHSAAITNLTLELGA